MCVRQMEHTPSWEHTETGITLKANKQENQKKKRIVCFLFSFRFCVYLFSNMQLGFVVL